MIFLSLLSTLTRTVFLFSISHQTIRSTMPAVVIPPANSWNYGTAEYDQKSVRSTEGYRLGVTTPILYMLGSVVFLIGAALCIASQGRFNLNPSPPFAVLPTLNGSHFVGFTVCAIIGSALWFIASIVALANVYGEVAQMRVIVNVTVTPLLGRYLIIGAWWAFLGTMLVLIGAAVFCGATQSLTSSGVRANHLNRMMKKCREFE